MLSNMLPVTLPSFNPRTRVGCDTSPATIRCRSSAFQSTHPRGVRHCGKLLARGWIVVSIHALAWGATAGAGAGLQHPAVSIHAPAWGATPPPPRRPRLISMFQSTHPRGVRRCPRPSTLPNSSSFNPRTRVGCDWCLTWRSLCDCGFQSTHPRGVRRAELDAVEHLGLVSIHAPAWGATLPQSSPRALRRVSIHAPAWGATWSRPAILR